jgi:hypothetical protein
MYLLFILLRILAINSRNSRLGEFNSRLARLKFPVRAATGIRRQAVDLACRFFEQMAVLGPQSKKFPAQREKPGLPAVPVRR